MYIGHVIFINQHLCNSSVCNIRGSQFPIPKHPCLLKKYLQFLAKYNLCYREAPSYFVLEGCSNFGAHYNVCGINICNISLFNFHLVLLIIYETKFFRAILWVRTGTNAVATLCVNRQASICVFGSLSFYLWQVRSFRHNF